MSFATDTIHADNAIRGLPDIGAPLRTSTTYEYPPGQDVGIEATSTNYYYSRIGHPNAYRVEQILEKIIGQPTLVFANGLGAFHAALVSLNPKVIMSATPSYHGCVGILKLLKRNYGIKVIDIADDPDQLGKGDVIHIETPVNPSGTARDIATYAKIAHERGALLLVDATFAPPPLSDPFQHGADLVMHSGSKYFGGHSDLLAGTLSVKNNEELVKRLWDDRLLLGTILPPMESWLLLRSLRTYEMRIHKQADNAAKIVEYLSTHKHELPLLKEVRHASLQTEPFVKEQVLKGPPTFSFLCVDRESAKAVPDKVKLFHHCTSLGGIESMLEWRLLSDATSPPELIRVSVGGENVEDLIEDLKRALT